MKIAFTVNGRPKGKGRPRFVSADRPPITPKATREAEKAIGWEFNLARRMRAVEIGQAIPIMTGTVALTIEAVFRVPVSWPRALRVAALAGEVEYTGKPDRDNIEKLVMDALDGVAWVDDAQVNRGDLVRRYGEPERIEITVEEAKAEDRVKSPAERRREVKVATGTHLKRKRRAKSSRGSELLAISIGKRIR